MMNKSTILESSTPAKIHKSTSLPISRNSGSGYEKPERARTSHACEPCRERKTKCDGERPSCHRCLHTGTGCHYGYGKGWRKRKTAEDLTVTSRKLQIYESLLNSIYPRVDSDIQLQIDEARTSEIAGGGTPEAMDSSSSVSAPPALSTERDSMLSGPANRLPLPLPLPNALISHNRPPPAAPSSIPFDRVSEATSPHIALHHKRDTGLEDSTKSRLPSITPQGLLIEGGLRDASPIHHHSAGSLTPARSDHFSPTATSPRTELSTHSGSMPRHPSR